MFGLCRGDVAMAVEDETDSIALSVCAEKSRWNDGKPCLLAKFPDRTFDGGLTIFEVTTRKVDLPVNTGIGFAYEQYSAIWIADDNTGCNSIFPRFCHFSSDERPGSGAPQSVARTPLCTPDMGMN